MKDGLYFCIGMESLWLRFIFLYSAAVVSIVWGQSRQRSFFRIEGYGRAEMYTGEFPMSSSFPASSSGSILPTGWGFGGAYIYEPVEHLQVEGGFALERWRKHYARAGEELKGFTHFGGWTSPPVPYETYYRGQVLKLRLGIAGAWGSQVESRLSGGLNMGTYTAVFGSADGNTAYSEPVSDVGLGYYLRFDLGFPVRSVETLIMVPSLFIALDYLAARGAEFKDFIWMGVTEDTGGQQLFGVGGYRMGIALRL